jgi:hypothetical protein
MPICDDPNTFALYTLRRENKSPNPLRFKVRCLTVAQQREYKKLQADALAKETEEEILDSFIEQIVKPYVTGWTSDDEFSVDRLISRLHPMEMIELATHLHLASLPSEEDLKKSASPA